MECLTDETVLAFVLGQDLPDGRSRQSIEAHLNECAACRSVVSEAARYFFEERTDAGSATDQATADGSVRSEPAILPQGHRVGRYEVLELIGVGGMGVIYAAHDPDLNRKVALKLLRPEIGAEGEAEAARRRLLREAQVMARLSHPNVVTVYDVGMFAGQVFVAMEYVEGMTLRVWLKAAPRRWRELLDVFMAAGRGLAAAHATGLVHRDFKPENVLVGNDGRVRVTDFGLARPAVREPGEVTGVRSGTAGPGSPLDQTLTQTGVTAGTPHYMAPEQFQGERLDPRADQFAFCATLFEALYGQRPFDGATREDLTRNVTEGRVRELPATTPIPEQVNSVVLRGLRVAREDRYASMDQLLAALIAAGRPTRVAAAPSGARPNWRVGALAVAFSLAAAGLFLGLRWSQHRTSAAAPALPTPAARQSRPAADTIVPPVPPSSSTVRASRVEIGPPASVRTAPSAGHRLRPPSRRPRAHKKPGPRHAVQPDPATPPARSAPAGRLGDKLKDPFHED